MGFSRKEYWSGLPFPSSGDLPDSRIESASLMSPAMAGRFFTTAPPGKPIRTLLYHFIGGKLRHRMTRKHAQIHRPKQIIFWVRFSIWLKKPLVLGNSLCSLDLRLPRCCGGKEYACQYRKPGDVGSIPGLGRSPGGGNDNPLQYSCLEKSRGYRSLTGYGPRARKELYTTEGLNNSLRSCLRITDSFIIQFLKSDYQAFWASGDYKN